MHRSGHLGVSLLLYAPIILLVEAFQPRLLLLTVVGAVLLFDLLLPVTFLLSLVLSRRWWGRFSLSLSMLPDLDMKIPGIKHRGITHTVWFAIGVGFLFGIGGSQFAAIIVGILDPKAGQNSGLVVVFFGYLGFHAVVTHLLGDVITPMGIKPFSPISDREYSLNLAKASNPVANTGLLILGIIATVISVGLVI